MQHNQNYQVGTRLLVSTNLNIFIPTEETIILEDVFVYGLTNFSVTVKNKGPSGKITNIKIYGSPNGIDFYLVQEDLFPSGIDTNTIEYANFFTLTIVMRITATSDTEDINADIWFHGNTT